MLKKSLALAISSIILTACGSGGGSSTPTTTADTNSNTIAIPNATNNSNNNSSTTTTPNNSVTTKVDMGNLSGAANYTGTMEYNNSAIHSRTGLYYPRSGTFTLNADFDKQTISGNGKLDTRQARSGNYRQIKNGATLNFEETKLYRDKDGDIAFSGTATGVVQDVLDATYVGASAPFDVKGTYEGYFSGNNAEKVRASFNVQSSEDSRVGAHGIMNGTKQ